MKRNNFKKYLIIVPAVILGVLVTIFMRGILPPSMALYKGLISWCVFILVSGGLTLGFTVLGKRFLS